MSRYRIPSQRCRAEIAVSNSRFITTLDAVFSVQQARSFVREIRREMPTASHHVHAFRVGYGNSVSEGLSDDGEPSGTAGPPAMAVVRGSDLGDVALVITRYFGGTKLGTGGLVAAYTRAAQAAFELLQTEEKIRRIGCTVRVPYATLERVRQLLARHEAIVDAESFDADVLLRFRLPAEHLAILAQMCADLTGGRATLIRTDE